MRLRLFALLLATLMTLSGCTQQVLLSPSVLPEPDAPYAAPIGDAGLTGAETVALYLPSRDGRRLLCQYEEISRNRGRHPAEAIVRTLLTHPGNDTAAPLSSEGALQLSGSVETSGGVCTVPLTASALRLSHSELYTVCLSLAATLCELPDVQAVNVLVGGQAISLDVWGYLPIGSVIPPTELELSMLWEQMAARRVPVSDNPSTVPLSSAATLYFPLSDSSGIVPEIRSISFSGQHPGQLAMGLLEALSSGAKTASGTSVMPDLTALLIRAPEFVELDNGGRQLTLTFLPALERTLREQNVDVACLAAALVWSLTTFVPELTSVQLFAGDSPITSLYNPAFGNLLFPGGVMRRSDFSAFLRDQATLDFVREGALAFCVRTMTGASAHHPRALLLALMEGPTAAEMAAGFSPVLPAGLTDADILGLAVTEDTLLVSLSDRFAQAIADSGMDQRVMCRSMVATLCRCMNVRRIRFFFGGQPRGDLSSSIDWRGAFLYTPDTTDAFGGF